MLSPALLDPGRDQDFQARVRSLGASAQVPSSGNILAVIPVGPAGRVPEASHYLNAWEQGENHMEISWGPGEAPELRRSERGPSQLAFERMSRSLV
jgi:hypothetical protein